MKNLTACLLVSLGPILPSIAADPSPSTWEQGEGFRRARRVAPPNTVERPGGTHRLVDGPGFRGCGSTATKPGRSKK